MPEIETALTAELFSEMSAGFHQILGIAGEFDMYKISGFASLNKAQADAKHQTGKLSMWFGKGKEEAAKRNEVVANEAQGTHGQIDAMVADANKEARRLSSLMFSGLGAKEGWEVDFGGSRFREAIQGGAKPDNVRRDLKIVTQDEAAALFEIPSDRAAFLGLMTLEQRTRELKGHTDASPLEKVQLAKTVCMKATHAAEEFLKATKYAPPRVVAPPATEPAPSTEPAAEKPFKAVFRTGGGDPGTG